MEGISIRTAESRESVTEYVVDMYAVVPFSYLSSQLSTSDASRVRKRLRLTRRPNIRLATNQAAEMLLATDETTRE